MSEITVVCERCDERVEGLIDAATTKIGDPLICSGGFRLEDEGAICDDCSEGDSNE